MGINRWLKKNAKSLENKNIVITGATGGLGEKLCNILASLNANVFIACRSEEKANILINTVTQKYKKANFSFLHLDLENIKSVKGFIDKLKKIKLDYLILNAGIYNVPLKKLDSGFNNVFQINFLYQYYIVKMLLFQIKQQNTKVIAVGSVAHNYSKINTNDIDFSSYKKPSKIYGNSKRFLMFALYGLAKENNFNLSIIHPGVTLTNMTNHYPKYINWLVKFGIWLVFPSPKKAVLNYIYGMFNNTDYHEWIGPSLFNIWGKPKVSKLKTCTTKESELIYKISNNLLKMIGN